MKKPTSVLGSGLCGERGIQVAVSEPVKAEIGSSNLLGVANKPATIELSSPNRVKRTRRVYNSVKPLVNPRDKHYTRRMLKERQAEVWSERIYRLRLKLALSQEQLAARVGCTRVSLCNWELGKRAPQPVFQGKIADLEEEAGLTF